MGSNGHRFFAWAFARMSPFVERGGLGERRQALLSEARGRVVELGAGTGANLRHYPPTVIEVVATEPDPHMFKRLPKALASAGVPIRLERAAADGLPFPDDSVDTVVATLVLCSVPDQAVALTEARRVLTPGGRLLFMEHVRADDPRLAARQDRWEPFHTKIAGGCHPNRDTLTAIRAAGFEVGELERYDQPGWSIVRPHIRGVATKPAVD